MWGERQHMTNKVLCIEIPNANSVRKTYQTSSSLCCFTLLPAEPDASFASLQRWLGWVKHNVKTETVPHQSYTEGPKSQRLGVYHWMHVYTYSFLGFCEYFNSHFPQFWGIFFFLSLYAKWLYLHAQSSWMLLWLVCSYEYNTGQTSVFWEKK